jgi:hypothetical protein
MMCTDCLSSVGRTDDALAAMRALLDGGEAVTFAALVNAARRCGLTPHDAAGAFWALASEPGVTVERGSDGTPTLQVWP